MESSEALFCFSFKPPGVACKNSCFVDGTSKRYFVLYREEKVKTKVVECKGKYQHGYD